MEDKQYVEQVRQYLYGQNKNPVEAAFILGDISERYYRFRGSHLTSDYYGLEASFEKVGSYASNLLRKLRKNEVPNKEELSQLEKCFDQLEKDREEDNRIYGARRSRIADELNEQQYRDAHMGSDGEWHPKGPD